jgi:hypothetical protein
MSLEVDSSFQLLVDDEVLLEHNGPVDRAADQPKEYGKKCCFGSCHGTSSLFNHAEAEERDTYINFQVPNSSFIDSFRWWSFEEALGANALEVYFHNGSYACYADVPQYIVDDWIEEIGNGGSAGRYYNNVIKNEFEAITEDDNGN